MVYYHVQNHQRATKDWDSERMFKRKQAPKKKKGVSLLERQLKTMNKNILINFSRRFFRVKHHTSEKYGGFYERYGKQPGTFMSHDLFPYFHKKERILRNLSSVHLSSWVKRVVWHSGIAISAENLPVMSDFQNFDNMVHKAHSRIQIFERLEHSSQNCPKKIKKSTFVHSLKWSI